MTSFTDQRPRVATQEDLDAPWNSVRRRYFRCYLCGYTFKVGDYWRWVYAPPNSNLIVCKTCDGEDVVDRWAEVYRLWEQMRQAGPFWKFIDQLERERDEERF